MQNSTFICMFFFFNDTATTEIYTLSLHDALPILPLGKMLRNWGWVYFGNLIGSLFYAVLFYLAVTSWGAARDRKSTRLNSSHSQISYAVFCLKKKKKKEVRRSTKRICDIQHNIAF